MLVDGNLDSQAGVFAGGSQQTTYEAADTGKGLAAAVIFSQVSKGVHDLTKDWESPFSIGAGAAFDALTEWFENWFDLGSTTSEFIDEQTRSFAVNYLQQVNAGGAPRPWPSLMTVYFMGTDHYLHEEGEGTANAQINTYLYDVLDDEAGDFTSELKRQNIFDLTQFVIVSDHGHTPVSPHEENVVSLVQDIFLWPWDEEELLKVFANCSYDLLKDAGEIDQPSQYNAVAALNGGMCHVYLRNRQSGQWADAPRWEEDVLEVAERFRLNHHTGVDHTELQNSIKGILVRDGFSANYQVYRLDGTLGSSTTPLSTTDRLLNLQSLEDFFNVAANRPALFASGSDAAAEINTNLKHKYSGDIIVLANGDPTSPSDRHAWQSGPEASVHGFFNDKDFRGTLMGGCPGGDSAAVSQLQGAFMGKTKLRETHDIIKTLLGL